MASSYVQVKNPNTFLHVFLGSAVLNELSPQPPEQYFNQIQTNN